MSPDPLRRTRGKTRPGRLRLLDPWLVEQLPSARRAEILDLGIGARPDTTVELLTAARASGRQARVTGTDVDAERVLSLARVADPDLRAAHVHAGWSPERPADLIRAANLLRQYALERVPGAIARWGGWLAEGGLLVEGSTDREGGRGVFRSFRRDEGVLQDHGLLFLVDLQARGFGPRALTAYLPRGLGWHGHPGPQLEALFSAWQAAFDDARAEGESGVPGLFRASAERLAERGLARQDARGWSEGRLFVPARVLSGELTG